MHVVKATNMRAGYGAGTVLESLDFTLGSDQTHGLIGPNAAGKTTALRAIAGQVRASGLEVFGEKPFDNQSVMDRTILMGIDAPLVDGWSLKKLAAIGAARWPNWDDGVLDELTERFELPLQQNYSGLSRGQKSAMGITCAFASGCELVLLDEPYLGLDVDKRREFYDVLEQFRGTRTIVVSTHHVNEIAGRLDTVLLLGKDGATIAGGAEEFANNILELAGPDELVDALVQDLTVLHREEGRLGTQAIVDMRGHSDDDIIALFDAARAQGRVRVKEITLENAVWALQGGGRHDITDL